MAFEIKRGDRRPRYRIVLTQSDPLNPSAQVPVDLTNATAAFFIMKAASGGAIKINRGVMTFTDRPNGVVEYAWLANDTDTPGVYEVEIEVDWAGEPQTFPSSGFFTVTIAADLG